MNIFALIIDIISLCYGTYLIYQDDDESSIGFLGGILVGLSFLFILLFVFAEIIIK